MKYRCIGIGFVLFFGVLFALQACAEKKIYTVGKPGDQTASLTLPNFIEIRSFDGDSVENLFTRIIYEGKKEVVFAAREVRGLRNVSGSLSDGCYFPGKGRCQISQSGSVYRVRSLRK